MTVIAKSSSSALLSVATIVLVPQVSEMEDGFRYSVTVAGSVGFTGCLGVSSSLIVTDVPVTVRPVDDPFTDNVSTDSLSASLVGVSVNALVPLNWPAGIVMVMSVTAV